MSSFFLFLRLSTAFEFDETFPVVPRVPLSLHDSFTHRDPSVSSRRRHLSPLHPYCRYNPRAIQRNLVSSRRLFPTFAGSQLSTPRLSNSGKTLPCSAPFSLSLFLSSSSTPISPPPSLGEHNSAEHLPPGFHSSPFFRFALVDLHRKQFIPRTYSHQAPISYLRSRQVSHNAPGGK